jgi:hypothetical protein
MIPVLKEHPVQREVRNRYNIAWKRVISHYMMYAEKGFSLVWGDFREEGRHSTGNQIKIDEMDIFTLFFFK